MEKAKLTTVSSVVAAIIASLCCIGPVVVALIGVGSIGAFAVFEAYRPYFFALTVLLLALAFYLTYRKREVICADGSCKIESAGRWSKITVWLAAGIAVVAVAFPLFDFTNATAAQAMLTQARQQNPALAVAVLDIEGMDCKGCAKGLEATLDRADGVRKAAVEFEKTRAVVEFDSTKISLQRLIAVVDETGFKAKPANSNTSHN
ncbi:MAG TPA: mercuric transporter MerT family protein [Bacteroidota bacterium]|nr:mercuric transporter MerT family protein [Bacteroidota bacterium]